MALEAGYTARACSPNGGINWFYHTNLWSCWRQAKRVGCWQVWSRSICFVFAALGHVAKHADAVELRVVVEAVLAVAADAVLATHNLPKLNAYLVTALARLHVLNLARRRSLEAGSTRDKKDERRGETKKT